MHRLRFRELTYRDPWAVSLAHRTSRLRDGSTRVAYLHGKADASTFRYRCHYTSQTLQNLVPGVGSSWFQESDGTHLLDVARCADVLVICRMPYSDLLGQVVQVARNFGTRILFDIDDFVFDAAMVPTVIATLDQVGADAAATESLYNFWFASFARMRRAMELTDGVIVTNEYLAERVREVVGLETHVVPNYLGTEQLELADALVAVKAEAKRTRAFHLGYFSGTPTHNRDFAVAAPAIARILRRRPEVKLRIVGDLSTEGWFPEDLRSRIEVLPRTNFLTLQRLIAEVELNIAPLQNNAFTNSKSELKYFDAGVVGVPTLASPTFTMRTAITDGVNGGLVADQAWLDRLERAVDSYDPSGVEMGARAREQVLSAYTPEANLPALLSALGLESGS